MPPIYEVTVLLEENDKEIYNEKVFAIDEDAAIDQVMEALNKKDTPYGLRMAEEI